MPSPFLDKPTLTGTRVRLRPVSVEDAPGLAEMVAEPENRRLTGTRGTFTLEQTERWYASRADADDRIDLAIVDLATDAYAGEVVLHEYDAGNNACGFRIGMLGRFADRGLGTEATRLAVGWAFEVAGVHRVELHVYAFNPRAIRVYEKVGFAREGVLRDALRTDDGYADSIVMSILAPEWAALSSTNAARAH